MLGKKLHGNAVSHGNPENYGETCLFAADDGIKDVATVNTAHEAVGIILGQLDDSGEKIINLNNDQTNINKNICVVGASSSGKSWCFILPFALQAARRRESLIVNDPKGDLYSKTADYFRQLGYVVRRFNLKEPELSDGWDFRTEASTSVSSELHAQISSSLSSPEVQKLISHDDIDLSLPGKQPCIYYCVMSDMQSPLNSIGTLFFSCLFRNLTEFADNQPNHKCLVPVNFLLDEFRSIGCIPDFDQKIATAHSRNMHISIILQDISQLRSRYPNTWSSIMSNCATHLCLGFNDEETAAYYSDKAGVATVKVKTEQHEAMEPLIKFGRKHRTGGGHRDVMTSDELLRLSLNECLIFIQSHKCVKARKFPASLLPEHKCLVGV